MIPLLVIGVLAQSQTSRVDNGMYRFTSNVEICDSVISRNNTYPQVHCMNGDIPTIGCRRYDSGCVIGQRIASDVHVPSYMYNYTDCNHYLWIWRCAYDWRICVGDKVCICNTPIPNPAAALHHCQCSSNNSYDMIGCPVRTNSPTTTLPTKSPTFSPTLTPSLVPTLTPTNSPVESTVKPPVDNSTDDESDKITILAILFVIVFVVASFIIFYSLHRNNINKRKIKKLEERNNGIINPVFDSSQENYAAAKDTYKDDNIERQNDAQPHELYETVDNRESVPVIYHGISPASFDYMNQDPNDEILATYDVVDDDTITENTHGNNINVPAENAYNDNLRFDEPGEYSTI